MVRFFIDYASEVIRKDYDRKCNRLRHQFAKGFSAQVVDKTRAVIKDLHSRIKVALHSVDSISKRIEKIRDEELQPQLVELVQGFTRMWKIMLECHHAQYLTISLTYHPRIGTATHGGETRKQAIAQLQYEFECFGLSFACWVHSHTLYVEFLNGWLQSCIMPPQESCRSRWPISPHRSLAPPIFVLCHDWAAAVKTLPSSEAIDAIHKLLSDLQQTEDCLKSQKVPHLNRDAEMERKEVATNGSASSMSRIHASLGKVLDRLAKFSEACLKLYEETGQKSEAAPSAYSNCKICRFD
ncbi:hypothetical protein Nepgr_007751 [Nepenthes gracilis]|uniref:DUF632 domain-containing protein n=1 Tax=Nepenthes gracilis TaxID=150966 RepID=A0AAD3XIT6_NEPGR|nr:hypothetical protein Nepgr_007751 [Nepenthes gracilis]